MAIQVQRRRGSTTDMATYTGAIGEVVLNTDDYQEHVSDGATLGGFLIAGHRVNAQSGTTYTMGVTDQGKLLTFNNASPVAVSLPQAGLLRNWPNGAKFWIYNRGAGSVTITPGPSQINGGGTLVLAQGQGGIVISDGTNYWAVTSNGGGTFALLGDVSLSSLLDKQYARYNSGTTKWENHSDGYFTTLLLNNNAATPPAGPTNTNLQVAVADGVQGNGVFDGFGTNTNYQIMFRSARNTAASPQALGNNDFMGNVVWRGFGATVYSNGNRARIRGQASEAWSDTAQGTRLDFSTTLNGSVGVAVGMTLENDGGLFGAGATGSSKGSGTSNWTNVYAQGINLSNFASLSNYDQTIYDSATSSWINRRARYIISAAQESGVLTNSQNILHHRVSKAITIPANFGSYLGHNSQAGGTANATGSTVINVDKAANATPNTFSNIGTITIAAGGTVPTFATSGGAAQNFAQGDVLRIQGPATADATFANFYATLVGFET